MTDDERATVADLLLDEAADDRRQPAREAADDRRREDGPQRRLWEDRR